MVIASMCDDPTSVGGKLGAVCQQTGLAYVSFGSCVPLMSTAVLLGCTSKCYPYALPQT